MAEHSYRALGRTIDGLLLEVREDEWNAYIPGWELADDSACPVVLLSLPGSLFLTHDAAMESWGAHDGPAFRSDAEYLSEVWGLTALGASGTPTEVADVPLLTLRVLPDGLAVELAGYPWLFRTLSPPAAAGWRKATREGWCLLGICLDMDLDEADAEDKLLSEPFERETLFGIVKVLSAM
ncbi:hypothetical protein [Streptomyces sp. PU-14G]|uniref:hypothetical protein n=1 Tax=Streptomyces sp. PU-14G TaxID=2800808 RepID=UPI0034DE7F44